MNFKFKEACFTFGKYKGESINKIISIDPSYVNWAKNNVKSFTLTLEQDCQLRLTMSRRIKLPRCRAIDLAWVEDWYEEQSWNEGMGL